MRRMIICADQAEFDVLNNQIQASLQASVPRYHADRWSNPIYLMNPERVAIPIEERVESFLSVEQRARIVEVP